MASPPEQSFGRLLIVSNRLPITVKHDINGCYQLIPTAGGLASALNFLSKSVEFKWYGWPGSGITSKDETTLSLKLASTYNAVPVLLDDQLAERYYNGFSNSALWPILHYRSQSMHFEASDWDAYKEVNHIFAQSIIRDVRDGDLIWIHDYHLMLLPALLHEEIDCSKLHITIGFFLHTPFPSSEIFRALPVCHELLKGVLQSHVIGFHTQDYAKHFTNSCACLLNLSTMPYGVQLQDRFVKVAHFPIGTNPESMEQCGKTYAICKQVRTFRDSFEDVKILLGVDRADYIKGLPQKLLALDIFYRKYPAWIGKALLIQVAIPSRQDVEEYMHLRSSISELVGQINGRYSTPNFVPVHYMDRSVNQEDLSALYMVSDVCVISSTRDGMNLVAYEYIASQNQKQGILVVSEFTGASQSLKGSMVVNPWDTEELADAIHKAVSLSEVQRSSRYKAMQKCVATHTSTRWGDSFIAEIVRTASSYNGFCHSQNSPSKKLTRSSTRSWNAATGFDGAWDVVEVVYLTEPNLV